MRKLNILNHQDMQVIMRKDFYDKFSDQLAKIEKDTGATYFGHNIIKNYRKKGHRISTFCNHESWHDMYWAKYFDQDLTEKVCHQAVEKNNFAVVSWQIGHELSPCCQERIKATQVKDGIIFSFKKPDNYIESFIIGWNSLKTEKIDVEYIFHLSSLLKPLRDYHWSVHDKV